MRAGKSRNPTSRPSVPDIPRVLTRSKVEAIRNHQLLLPPRLINTRVLDLCAQVLTQGEPALTDEAIARAWMALKTRICTEDKQRVALLHRKRLVLLVVLMALLIAGLCVASGVLPWIKRMLWDNEYLTINLDGGSSYHSEVEQLFAVGDELEAAMRNNGMTVTLPSWFPEGYNPLSLDVFQLTETWIRVIASYSDGERTLFLQVDRMQEESAAHIIEKDASAIFTFVDDAVTVAIYENLGFVSARYFTEPYIVEISGNGITTEDAITMIESALGRNFTYEEHQEENVGNTHSDLPNGSLHDPDPWDDRRQ